MELLEKAGPLSLPTTQPSGSPALSAESSSQVRHSVTAGGVFIALTAYLLRGPLVRLFVRAEDATAVVPLGMDYLSLMAWLYVLPALTNCFQGFYRGTARFRVTVMGTLIQVTLRFLFTCILAPAMGIRGIAAACGIGWTIMLAVIVPYYFVLKRRDSGSVPEAAQ